MEPSSGQTALSFAHAELVGEQKACPEPVEGTLAYPMPQPFQNIIKSSNNTYV